VLPTYLDIVCLSHLRWDFVYQRPQHLMSRFARQHRVFFVEEPIDASGDDALGVTTRACGAEVLVPQLRPNTSDRYGHTVQQRLIERHLASRGVTNPLLWYYTPMALPFTRTLADAAVVYDCMDELTAFHGAPAALAAHERDLFARADVVFAGGRSLHESKRQHHPCVHAFPSSVDVDHFSRARTPSAARDGDGPLHVGFMGVVDERFDLLLIEAIARARPAWRITVLGPVVKIDVSSLPRLPNIVYTGLTPYAELPEHLSEWHVALIPFVREAVTRYVSPTKLLEYFAAGLPVVSTSIADVIEPYGAAGYVRIADGLEPFLHAIGCAAADDRAAVVRGFDRVLDATSWDRTWTAMTAVIEQVLTAPSARRRGSGRGV
jgi:UDP-galactopyranose mutase